MSQDNIMLTMGSDFNYEAGDTWFKNLDKLIYYANMDVGSNLRLFHDCGHPL